MPSILNATTTSGLVTSADNSGSLQLQTNNGTTAVTIDTSQNVGIGTTSPAVKFDVTGTVVASGLNARITNTDTDSSARAAIQFKTGASSNVWQTFAINGALVTGVAGVADYMRITSGGNVLVGQTGQTGAERVGISFDRTGQWGLAITNTSATSPSNATYVSFYYTTTNTGSINSTGTTTSYGTSSDYRLKENIAPMAGALAKVAQLKPCTYVWKSTGESSQGFIAHELQEVVPECVTGEKDAVDEEGNIKPQSVDTSFLVATLTAAIQELKAELDTVKAELNTLKNPPVEGTE